MQSAMGNVLRSNHEQNNIHHNWDSIPVKVSILRDNIRRQEGSQHLLEVKSIRYIEIKMQRASPWNLTLISLSSAFSDHQHTLNNLSLVRGGISQESWFPLAKMSTEKWRWENKIMSYQGSSIRDKTPTYSLNLDTIDSKAHTNSWNAFIDVILNQRASRCRPM